jgi:hypothetical protein
MSLTWRSRSRSSDAAPSVTAVSSALCQETAGEDGPEDAPLAEQVAALSEQVAILRHQFDQDREIARSRLLPEFPMTRGSAPESTIYLRSPTSAASSTLANPWENASHSRLRVASTRSPSSVSV